jgi:hypothetical protein
MTDTGERREIKARTGAKEAEIVAESKKLPIENLQCDPLSAVLGGEL